MQHHNSGPARQVPYLQTTALPLETDGPGPEQPSYNATITRPQPPSLYTHQVRDGTNIRGRIPAVVHLQNGLPSSHGSRAPSVQRGPAELENGLQRRTSNHHHRQTSVIHGLQHSRNTSFNSPSTASPLGPESPLYAATSPAASVQGHSQTPSIDAAIAENSPNPDVGRQHARKRTTGSRSRRGHAYQNSSSHYQPEPQTPGEYALGHLFTSFMQRADQKIEQSLTRVDVTPDTVESICGPHVDPLFDQLLSALAHVVRSEPKPLVDSLMIWRQAKREALTSLKQRLGQQRSATSALPANLPRRHTEPLQTMADYDVPPSHTPVSSSEPLTEAYLEARRRTEISVYILCRVLLEIFQQSTLEAITLNLAIKLEEIVFGQLRESDPASLYASSLFLANWRIYGQVLGQMGRLHFVSVTSRFLKQLELWQQELARSSSKELEDRIEILLLSMRHIHVSSNRGQLGLYTSFLTELGNLFASAHGARIKQTYCQLLSHYLTGIASSPSAVQNFAQWKPVVDASNTKVQQMLEKPRHWESSFPLSVLLLCFQPLDHFMHQWTTSISTYSSKLRDRASRTLAMQALCRLTWTYLYRTNDPAQARIRKLEEVVRAVFPLGKKTLYVTTETLMAEAIICFVRIVGAESPELCFRHIISPLLGLDIILSGREIKAEHLDPERAVLGIRSFLAVVVDAEAPKQHELGFPTFSSQTQLDSSSINSQGEHLHLGLDSSQHSTADPVMDFETAINPALLHEPLNLYYARFCEALGKIMIACDNAFGAQATSSEKALNLTPKTPLVDAFSLPKKEDAIPLEQRHHFHGLLHVLIKTAPRCLSENMPLNALLNLLCTATLHPHQEIAASATKSLKAMAKQGYAQSVAIALPRSMFLNDTQGEVALDVERPETASLEASLALYVDLLAAWVAEVKQKARGNVADADGRRDAAAVRALQMEMTTVMPHVDEAEGHGVFFLCSESTRVRAYAVQILQHVAQFDSEIGKTESTRVVDVLETCSDKVLNFQDDELTIAERTRLQKDKRRSTKPAILSELTTSDYSYDISLWQKAFPKLIRLVFERCPHAIALSRGMVCERLLPLQRSIEAIVNLATLSANLPDGRRHEVPATPVLATLCDQWKYYLIMACATLSSAGAQSQSQLANAAHTRKTSKGNPPQSDKLSSARQLFSAVIPLLSATQEAVRDAVVLALGSINRKLYRTLLESLQYAVITCNDEAKARISTHNRTPSSPQRSQVTQRLRTEVAHVYKLTAAFLRHDDVLSDDWILNNIVTYTKDLRLFLSDAEIQADPRFQKLRFHYCGLIEEVFTGVNRASDPFRWLPFEARKSAFSLMEDWCGYSGSQEMNSSMDPTSLAYRRDHAERMHANAASEKDKNNLRLAALNAMATFCAGPILHHTEGGGVLSFSLPRIISWIEATFASTNDKMHNIGRRALKSLLLNNANHPVIMEHALERCYQTGNLKTLESWFGVIADVLIQDARYPVAFWKVLCVVLFTLGSDLREIRTQSAHLLRILDDRQQKRSNLQEFDISISDRTRAVYKLAQFEYSKRLAQAHPELAFTIFSGFCLHFKQVNTDDQRNMVAAILPWLQTMELQVIVNQTTGEGSKEDDKETKLPTAESHMLLANMFEITVRFSNSLHNEVQALWQALATGPHAGNVQLMLDFIIYLSINKRDQNFVEYSKQIVVYLSSTPAGSRVLEFFLLQLDPKHMVTDRYDAERPEPDVRTLPYTADITDLLPTGAKQVGLSLGQVALIFLVDLIVPPISLPPENAIKLIHASLMFWDHYNSIVQEHARELIIHLIHELVTTKVAHERLLPEKEPIEQIVDGIHQGAMSISWNYEDYTGKDEDEDGGKRVPAAMAYMTEGVVKIFSLAFEDFRDLWARQALFWTAQCPVRHLACRSLQMFRCISHKLDPHMLGEMLARLSNTISDEKTNYLTFSIEILATLKSTVETLDIKFLQRFYQLFWTTCACLDTIHEQEFYQALMMLEAYLPRLDFSDPGIVKALLAGKPDKWHGEFVGLQPLLYKGLKSDLCFRKTLEVLQQMAKLPDNELVGLDDRLLYTVLANLPDFLYHANGTAPIDEVATRASVLASAADAQLQMGLSSCLRSFASGRYRNGSEFLKETLTALKVAFFAQRESSVLLFMMGLLTNRDRQYKISVMDTLCELIPMIDMKNASIVNHGADAIAPLLRLLQTEYCQKALQVMDNIMFVTGNPMEKSHMRMSMASGLAQARKYGNTQSLYGVPMSSGWSIPVPAKQAQETRENVHLIFYSCGDTAAQQVQVDTPEIEFHPDEGYADSYFPPQETERATIRSMEIAKDTNIGDIVTSLDSLDDFFDDEETGSSTPTVIPHYTIPEYMKEEAEAQRISLYEEQTLPILQQTLARTGSTTAFYEDMTPPNQMSRAPSNVSMASNTLTYQHSFSSIDEVSGPGPSLPNSGKKANDPGTSGMRPGLHSRSITSPAHQFPVSQTTASSTLPSLPQGLSNMSFPDLDGDDAMLSDGESSPFPAITTTLSNPARMLANQGVQVSHSPAQLTPTSATEGGGSSAFSSMRRGMRRLTGGKSESRKEAEKVRDINRLRALSGGQNLHSAPILSPKVPRVPVEYLNGGGNQGNTG